MYSKTVNDTLQFTTQSLLWPARFLHFWSK